MKLSESLSFDVYNMHAKAGKWVFRAPEFILKRGVTRFYLQAIPCQKVKKPGMRLRKLDVIACYCMTLDVSTITT